MMDVKFRSVVCLGLNEQVLHLWLESLCSSLAVVEKWYHPWSFLRSPGGFCVGLGVWIRLSACVRACILCLNEQVLHLLLETLCSSLEVVEMWYHLLSFLRSPDVCVHV